MLKRIVSQKKSLVPSLDVASMKLAKKIVKQTSSIDQVSSYKVGFELALRFGLKKTVQEISRLTDKPIVYDHQKGATDIPDTGEKFAQACSDCGVDAVIIFPFTGPKTCSTWIEALLKKKLGLIVGSEMTHQNFLHSENGYISDDAPKKIFELAAKHKVSNFVASATKTRKLSEYKSFLTSLGVKPVFFLPGVHVQGGTIQGIKDALHTDFHAIIGRALYESRDVKKTCQSFAEQL